MHTGGRSKCMDFGISTQSQKVTGSGVLAQSVDGTGPFGRLIRGDGRIC